MACAVVKDRKETPFYDGDLGLRPHSRHIPVCVQKGLSVQSALHTGPGKVQGAWEHG